VCSFLSREFASIFGVSINTRNVWGLFMPIFLDLRPDFGGFIVEYCIYGFSSDSIE